MTITRFRANFVSVNVEETMKVQSISVHVVTRRLYQRHVGDVHTLLMMQHPSPSSK